MSIRYATYGTGGCFEYAVKISLIVLSIAFMVSCAGRENKFEALRQGIYQGASQAQELRKMDP